MEKLKLDKNVIAASGCSTFMQLALNGQVDRPCPDNGTCNGRRCTLPEASTLKIPLSFYSKSTSKMSSDATTPIGS